MDSLSSSEAAARDDAPAEHARAAGTVHSVGRALRVLEAIADAPNGASAKHLAFDLGFTLPATYDLLASLVDGGHVVHVSDRQVYELGHKARYLGEAMSRRLSVHPDIERVVDILHRQADAAAYYAVYRDTDIVIAHIEDSDRRPRIRPLDIGFREAVHATAFGKIMLAAMTGDRRSEYLDHAELQELTPRTICDREALEEDLTHVQGSQIAMEIGEFHSGLACMGAPVHGAHGGIVASVAISLPVAEFRARRWNVERAVRESAVRITRSLTRLGIDSQ